jgi:hypothetical protein
MRNPLHRFEGANCLLGIALAIPAVKFINDIIQNTDRPAGVYVAAATLLTLSALPFLPERRYGPKHSIEEEIYSKR